MATGNMCTTNDTNHGGYVTGTELYLPFTIQLPMNCQNLLWFGHPPLIPTLIASKRSFHSFNTWLNFQSWKATKSEYWFCSFLLLCLQPTVNKRSSSTCTYTNITSHTLSMFLGKSSFLASIYQEGKKINCPLLNQKVSFPPIQTHTKCLTHFPREIF